MPRDSVGQTLKVAALLCVVCSVVVSGAAVGLRPKQEENRRVDRQKNILLAAGLYDPHEDHLQDVPRLFRQIETRVVDLQKGQYVPENKIDPATFSQIDASRDPVTSDPVGPEQSAVNTPDVAKIRRRERYSFVYLVKNKDGVLQSVVVPIRGYGLWSTLFGYLAVDADFETVRGLTYYQHGETPGLGGEVDNPDWKRQWVGKKIYDPSGHVALELVKGSVEATDPLKEYHVDGLSGATITSRGVTNMMKFWLGPHGFQPFFDRQRAEMPHGSTGTGD